MNEKEYDRTKDEDYTESLEYLRAKYLNKGKIDYARLREREEVKPAGESVPVQAESAQSDGLDALRNKYSAKNKNGFSGLQLDRPTVCDILLLGVVFITALCTLLWFATPVTELGGEIYNGATLNLFSFLFGSKSSMYSQIKACLENFRNIEANAADGIGSVMKLVRALLLCCCGLNVLVRVAIEIVFAPIYFYKKKRAKLVSVSVKSVTDKLSAYVIFVFFGSVSGGVGPDSYYIGYRIGTGTTVGILLGLSILIGVFVIGYLSNRTLITLGDKRQLKRFIVSCVAYTAMTIIVTLMRIYSVFMYSITSALTAAVGLGVGGFKLKVIVFPLLNVLLLYACCLIVRKVIAGCRISYEFLLRVGENLNEKNSEKVNKRIKGAQSKDLFVAALASAISCLAVFALNIPEIGFGWSVNIYPHLIAIFALSSTGWGFNAILLSDCKRKK